MKKILMNTLSQSGFVVLNKALIKYFQNLDVACLLSFLIDKWAYYKGDDFYYTIENLKQDLFLSERSIRTALKLLIDKNILIKKSFEGLPPKQYYNINYQMVINILSDLDIPCKNDRVDTCKNDRVDTCKNDRVDTCKNDRDLLYSNNKFSNNKENNNKFIKENNTKEKENQIINQREKKEKDYLNSLGLKNIPKTKQELKEFSIKLYNANDDLLFSIDNWLDWVDYKLEKDKKIGYSVLKHNFKQLINFNTKARESIKQSINCNYSGLFEPRNAINKIDSNLLYDNTYKDEEDKEWDELIKRGGE